MRTPLSRITVLSGGIGGAKFITGLLHGIAEQQLPGVAPDAEVTVIANTADDLWWHGLKVCPDLDSIMYTLGGGIDTERGWGRADESWRVLDELKEYGVEPTWFGLGDRDLATHVVRTEMLEAGYALSEVTTALCRRWQPGVRLLPMTDDRVESHVVIADDSEPSGRRAMHFQEYWVRHRASMPAEAMVFVGQDSASPAPGVTEAIGQADLVLLSPSNPVVSIGTILGVPGISQALRGTEAPVVGFSPIIGGGHVSGMADQLLPSQGIDVSAAGVGAHYGARSGAGVLDAWLVDTSDEAALEPLRAAGLRSAAVPLYMSTPTHTAAMVAAAVELVGS